MLKSSFINSAQLWKNSVLAGISIALIIAIAFSAPVSAAQLYRYKDDQGNYVLNQMIPPKYVSKGYDILNDKGRLIRRVAPALTPEQIAERDAAREQERLRKIEQEKQRVYDNELKQLYSHPNDTVRVLSRRVQDIHGVIQVKRGRIDAARKNIFNEEAKAADRQRRGLSISQATLEQLDKFKNDIINSEHDITELYSELDKVKEEFDLKIKRMEQITGKQATDYPALLESIQTAKEIETPIDSQP